MWQKCPICNGEGKIQNYGTVSSVLFSTCITCNGTRIISEINGLPPNNSIDAPKSKLREYIENIDPTIHPFDYYILKKLDDGGLITKQK